MSIKETEVRTMGKTASLNVNCWYNDKLDIVVVQLGWTNYFEIMKFNISFIL